VSYLDRLRDLDDFSGKPPGGSDKSIKTSIEGSSGTFDTTLSGTSRKIESTSGTFDTASQGTSRKIDVEASETTAKAKLHNPSTVSWRWLVRHPDGTWTDHTTTPWATEAAMRAAYPDALEFRALGNSLAKMEGAA
jgi:hypothetical protein